MGEPEGGVRGGLAEMGLEASWGLHGGFLQGILEGYCFFLSFFGFDLYEEGFRFRLKGVVFCSLLREIDGMVCLTQKEYNIVQNRRTRAHTHIHTQSKVKQHPPTATIHYSLN